MSKSVKSLAKAVFILVISKSTYATSFSLYTESNGSAIANFAAGIAAEASDASIGWYNPAGLPLLHKQELVLSGVGIFPVSELTGTSTFSTHLLPSYNQSFDDLDGAKQGVVPSLHYALPLGEDAAFGLSVVSPFGLKTSWGKQSPVRYAATLSDLFTVDISPELGGRLTDNLFAGLGLDIEYSRVIFNSMVGAPALMQFEQSIGLPVTPSFLDSESYNKGHSVGFGFHAGLLAKFNNDHTRLGANYQSKVRHQFHGYSRLTGRFATPELNPLLPGSILPASTHATAKTNRLYSNDIEFPDTLTLSLYQDINEKLALLGSVVYTGWSVFKEIELHNVLIPTEVSPFTYSPALGSVASPEHYKDSWRFAAGANYHFTDQWMLRFGGGYDNTPIRNAYRSVRIPDANRWVLGIGGHYDMTPTIGVDLGYAHYFAADTAYVNRTDILDPLDSYTVNARVNAYANLVGIQLNWIVDKDIASPTK